MNNERALAQFDRIRADLRDEIKRRIEQRDKYSIQLTVALGIVFAVSFPSSGFSMELARAIIAAPLISLYFTVLILYSYRIHGILAQYMRTVIEPEISNLAGIPLDKQWENYYTIHAVPGIRRAFFMIALWVVTLVSLAYLWSTQMEFSEFRGVLIASTAIYLVSDVAATWFFWK